jgi:hypothetical protein
MAAHRYWRMNITATGTGASGIAELEFRDAVGGADKTGSGTASAQTAYPGWPASQAFDNNTGTGWASNDSPVPQWIGYDFGSGNAYNIVEVYILPRQDGNHNQAPTAFDWQYSDDGSSWTTAVTKSGITWPTNAAQVFTVGYALGIVPAQFFDRYQSTVATAYTAGGTSLIVASAAGLPATGDFWLLVEADGANTEEVLKVTVVTGTTLTVVGAQANTTASSHGAGAVIRGAIMTSAAIVQMKRDIASSMTVSAFDTETTSGTANPAGRSVVYLSDGVHQAIWNGTVWEFYHGSFKTTRPLLSQFAWVNQGAATATQRSGIVMTAPTSSGLQARLLKKAAPSTPYSIVAAWLPSLFSSNSNECGVFWRSSSSGAFVAVRLVAGNNTIAIGKWNSASSYSADYVTITQAYQWEMFRSVVWVKMEDDGTNRKVHFSSDGQNWVQVHTVSRTDFITADEVGFYMRIDLSTSPPCYMSLLSFG